MLFKLVLTVFAQVLKLSLAIAALFVALKFRTPLLASIRDWSLGVTLVVTLGLIALEVRHCQIKSIQFKQIASFLIVAIASASFLIAAGTELKFQQTKQRVLNADSATLATLGQHFVVGYRDFDEVKTLVEKKAISGVFITLRNIQNKTKAEITQEVQALQTIRASQKLPPLWISTDQEGGIVSRLSPPLTKLPQLSTTVENNASPEQQKAAVLQYATTQGQELSELGINLNFAPVVDLNKGIVNPEDKFSQIYRRAISGDPQVVANVALWYCQTLEKYGVHCTIKHFPGLGRVVNDTHLNDAELNTPVEILNQEDWVPFRYVMQNSSAFTMVGHAKLMAIDAQHPVSFSQPILTGIIRKNWQHDGILITDDFCMHPAYGSKGGVGNATVKAMNAGMDLILIAYDKDVYYDAMNALLNAEQNGSLDREALNRSQQRLTRSAIVPLKPT